jgi:hypothetical protein
MSTNPESHEPLATGSHGDYKWLSSLHDLTDLVRLCPSVVLGKYIAVTSIDSGDLVPTDVERLAGWTSRDRIAYSPLVQSVENLRYEGWNEWYVFAQPVDLGASRLGSNIFDPTPKAGEVGVFVNYCFALHRPEMKSISDLFWEQLERMRPLSYIADNETLTFVTRDESLFNFVAEALSHPSG